MIRGVLVSDFANVSVDFDFDLIAIGIADERRKAFAGGAIVDFGLGGIKAFALESGDHIVDAGAGGLKAEMLLAQVCGRRRIGGAGFEKIEYRIPGAQSDHGVSGLGLAFTLYRQTEPLDVELLHVGQILRDQRYMIKTFIDEHANILSLRNLLVQVISINVTNNALCRSTAPGGSRIEVRIRDYVRG